MVGKKWTVIISLKDKFYGNEGGNEKTRKTTFAYHLKSIESVGRGDVN
jgi:hypothetical protein